MSAMDICNFGISNVARKTATGFHKVHKAYTIFYIVELSKPEVLPLLSLNLSIESYWISFFSYEL